MKNDVKNSIQLDYHNLKLLIKSWFISSTGAILIYLGTRFIPYQIRNKNRKYLGLSHSLYKPWTNVQIQPRVIKN